MASKMVSSFRRSVSFPNPPSASNVPSRSKKTHHVRSASLPCRTHPIISHLRDQISELHYWSAAVDRTSFAWLCDGLRRLKSVHESLDDLLHLPQARESLRGGARSDLLEKFLEDLLGYVDVYGTFQTLAIRLKEECSAAQAAVRRKDDSKIASRSKNLKRIAKEIGKLAASVGFVSVWNSSARAPHDDEAEMIEDISDVLEMTVVVSGQLFGRLSNSSAFRKPSGCIAGMGFGVKPRIAKVEGGIREFEEMDLGNMRKRGDEEVKTASKKMHEMEDRITEIQGCGERAFRSLINTRVSLLNVVTMTHN